MKQPPITYIRKADGVVISPHDVAKYDVSELLVVVTELGKVATCYEGVGAQSLGGHPPTPHFLNRGI